MILARRRPVAGTGAEASRLGMPRASLDEFVEIFDLESQTSAWGLAVAEAFFERPAANRATGYAAVGGGLLGV